MAQKQTKWHFAHFYRAVNHLEYTIERKRYYGVWRAKVGQNQRYYFQLKPDTISEWYKRWNADDLTMLYDEQRPGRPPSLTESEKKTFQMLPVSVSSIQFFG